MKHLLITGFDPFGGETVNPSWEAVRQLPDRIGAWQLHKREIPTVFGAAAQAVLAAAQELQPDAILCVGQAGGRSAITPELVAVNLREARIPDNHGDQPREVPVVPEGPAAYFSTVPVRAMVQAIRDCGLSGEMSLSAGAFVCNDVLYTLLHHYEGSDVQVGFIHVPYLPRQAAEGKPSMAEENMIRGLEAAVGAM